MILEIGMDWFDKKLLIQKKIKILVESLNKHDEHNKLGHIRQINDTKKQNESNS